METKVGFFFFLSFFLGNLPTLFMDFGIFCTKKCGAKQNVVAWRKTEATTQFRNSSGRGTEPMFCPVISGHYTSHTMAKAESLSTQPPCPWFGALRSCFWSLKKDQKPFAAWLLSYCAAEGTAPLLSCAGRGLASLCWLSSLVLPQHLRASLPQETRLLSASRTFLSLSWASPAPAPERARQVM